MECPSCGEKIGHHPDCSSLFQWNLSEDARLNHAMQYRIAAALEIIVNLIEQLMTPQIVNALIAALNALAALVTSQAGNAAALKTAQDALAALQATDAALQDPALVAASNAALAAAAAANPPAKV
jgi:hypothetical protein